MFAVRSRPVNSSISERIAVRAMPVANGKMSHVQFQIMSDLHLETPQARPTYDEFEIQARCPHLALLGDIGSVSDHLLFDFLERQLQQFEIVFYLLGNHEPYGISLLSTKATMRHFEANVEQRRISSRSRMAKFVFLDQTRYDCSEDLTVFGCTLFSRIASKQRESVSRFVADFSNIDGWTTESHNSAHQADLDWLNSQISHCARKEPHRSIVVFTHHSPTVLQVANDPNHVQDLSQVRSAFVTDLSGETCWTTDQVKVWGFGHTHFNCDFQDPQTRKQVVANQKGYRRAELDTFSGVKVVTVGIRQRPDTKESKRGQGQRTVKSKLNDCVVL